MTPKEKALDLVEDMRDCPEVGYNEHAKQCALIAADEVINIFSGVHKKLIEIDMLEGSVEETATYKYWQEVKQEIEQL
jgi:hypothetical protein